jgi:hypothetical protein
MPTDVAQRGLPTYHEAQGHEWLATKCDCPVFSVHSIHRNADALPIGFGPATRCVLAVVISLAISMAARPGYSQLPANEPVAKPVTENAGSASALDSVAPAADDISKWIGELSHDAFTVRQAAASRLLSAGPSARDALLVVVDGPDPEARAAARRLVALIDRTEFNRRLEAFAADTDGRRGLTLPGWKQFRELIGSDAAARELFVDMQRAESALLSAAFEASSKPAEQIWEERLMRLVSWQPAGNRTVPAPLGSCAAMLFLGSVSEFDVSDRAAVLLDNLVQRAPIRDLMVAGGPQDSIRRLVVAWLVNCPNKNENILAHRLTLISTFNLKEALPLALEVAGADKQFAGVQPGARAIAVLVIGQLGGKEHIDLIEPLLDDATVCMPLQAPQPGKVAGGVQVRDVALVVMLHLTGQRAADYGYLHARLQPQQTFQLQTLHAASDEARAQAIAKWRAWREANKGRESRDEGTKPEARATQPAPK